MPADYNHPSNSQVLAGLIRRFHEARSSGGASVTCWGIGSPVREFPHVDDLADAAVFCLEQWQPGAGSSTTGGGEASEALQHLNVGIGLEISIKELAQLVAGAVRFGREILRDTDKPDWHTPQAAGREPAAGPWLAGLQLSRCGPLAHGGRLKRKRRRRVRCCVADAADKVTGKTEKGEGKLRGARAWPAARR